jgi:hypothetical protein
VAQLLEYYGKTNTATYHFHTNSQV